MRIKGIVIILMIISVSCSKLSYKITTEKISSNKEIKDGFYLSEILVKKIDKEGKPVEYNIGETFFCGPINFYSGYLSETKYSKAEKDIVLKNKMVMDTIMHLNGNTIGGVGHDTRIEEYIDCKNVIDSLEKKHFPFDPQKSIFFYENNENYKWTYTIDSIPRWVDYEKGVHDIFPEKIKIEQWYLINLSNASNIINRIYFRIKQNYEIEKHHEYWEFWSKKNYSQQNI